MTPEAALRAIKNALSPKPKKAKGGFLIDGDAYYNLDGVRIDLKRMGADTACVRTIERVQKQLIEVTRVLKKAGLK